MGVLDMFRKNRKSGEIRESIFECKRDGLVIRGTEYRPRGEKLPIAIVCHGFMAWQDTVKQYARPLAEMGYAAFCFDFCGGCVMKGKSEGKTEEMSVLTEVKDLEAVIEYTRSLDYVDSEKILLMGCSQGGFVAALAAAKNRYPVKKLCLIFPALCIPDDARAGQMMMARFDPANVPEIFHCGPMKLGRRYPMDVMEMDPFEAIRPYAGKVCIIHGDKDPVVKLSYSERAVEAYLSTMPEDMNPAERVRLHVIEGAVHGFTKKQDVRVLEMIRAFLAEGI